MEIIKRAQYIVDTYYRLEFDSRNEPGSGYSFECDANGDLLDIDASTTITRIKSSGEYLEPYVKAYNGDRYERMVIRCDCGHEMKLTSRYSNKCVCGREYNGFGSLLATRNEDIFSEYGW